MAPVGRRLNRCNERVSLALPDLTLLVVRQSLSHRLRRPGRGARTGFPPRKQKKGRHALG